MSLNALGSLDSINSSIHSNSSDSLVFSIPSDPSIHPNFQDSLASIGSAIHPDSQDSLASSEPSRLSNFQDSLASIGSAIHLDSQDSSEFSDYSIPPNSPVSSVPTKSLYSLSVNVSSLEKPYKNSNDALIRDIKIISPIVIISVASLIIGLFVGLPFYPTIGDALKGAKLAFQIGGSISTVAFACIAIITVFIAMAIAKKNLERVRENEEESIDSSDSLNEPHNTITITQPQTE